MKRLLLVVILCLIASPVFAEPWLACSPQGNTEGFVYTLNGGPEVKVAYTTRVFSDGITRAVIADLASLPEGPFTFSVKAYNTWGQSSAVPFVGSKQSPGSPSSLAIAR